MKFTSAVVVLLLGAASSNAYTPAFVPTKLGSSSFVARRTTTLPSHSSTMTMFTEPSGGMEQLNEFLEQTTSPLAKQAQKSPSLFKMAGMASIPVGAALGFGIVPSRRIAAHAVGALVTGIAGAVGKSRLDALTEASAKPALAQAIVDEGLEDVEHTRQAVADVQERFGLLDEDFEIMATEVYASYLQGMVKYNPSAKTSEPKELQSLKTVLNLNNLAVGEAHAAAAQAWYRATCLFTPAEEMEDPEHPDRQAMDKMLFLTDRTLRAQNETEEAFLYEMTRVAKAVDLTFTEALERVADVVEPFYMRALQSTRSKLGTSQVSAEMLQRARQTLGVSDETAVDMHVATFNEEVRACLGLSEKKGEEEDADQDNKKVKFGEGAPEKVSRSCLGDSILRFASNQHFALFHSWNNSEKSSACRKQTPITRFPLRRVLSTRPPPWLP
jgi:hypothetical protein